MGHPPTVVIYDRVRQGDVRAMNARVAVCYVWADTLGIRVVDEHLDWPIGGRTSGSPDLVAAIKACRRHQARLLVHSLTVLDVATQLSTARRGQLSDLLLCIGR